MLTQGRGDGHCDGADADSNGSGDYNILLLIISVVVMLTSSMMSCDLNGGVAHTGCVYSDIC
ncbi:hypothetical protein DPMN_051882 [Dreissena polymorpha]|uniref:Uncharacterized protein n=1 Tax=Dreissena polymorpha TaxID=45954 RepID=A0A9D4HMJ1_DREPO|nr:hypothetical protein DPMN_051882 [Dreissena polymorpha]